MNDTVSLEGIDGRPWAMEILLDRAPIHFEVSEPSSMVSDAEMLAEIMLSPEFIAKNVDLIIEIFGDV